MGGASGGEVKFNPEEHEGHEEGSSVAEALARAVIDAGLKVHRALGPGLLESAYRLDIVVESAIIVEIKAVDTLTRVHDAQVITYLKLSGYRIGFLMNFDVALIKQGLTRLVL